jgi:hypothetical protein
MVTFHSWAHRQAFTASNQLGSDAAREIADELAEADADYAAGDTVGGEVLRDRYGLE